MMQALTPISPQVIIWHGNPEEPAPFCPDHPGPAGVE